MTPKEALHPVKKSIGNHGWFGYEEVEAIEQALNELERLKKFKETFDNYELAKKQDFIAYENWLECEKELEELRRDVARYFELASGQYVKDFHVGKISWMQYSQLDDEEQELKEKVTKVGREE